MWDFSEVITGGGGFQWAPILPFIGLPDFANPTDVAKI